MGNCRPKLTNLLHIDFEMPPGLAWLTKENASLETSQNPLLRTGDTPIHPRAPLPSLHPSRSIGPWCGLSPPRAESFAHPVPRALPRAVVVLRALHCCAATVTAEALTPLPPPAPGHGAGPPPLAHHALQPLPRALSNSARVFLDGSQSRLGVVFWGGTVTELRSREG